MPTTTANNTLLAAVSVAPGGTKAAPSNGAASPTVDLSGHYGAEVYVKITNGGTGPTLAAAVSVYASPDGTDWYEVLPVYGDLIAGSTQSYALPIDIGIRFIRADAYGNTGQAVTVSVYATRVTGL